jgi:hypothetical protein
MLLITVLEGNDPVPLVTRTGIPTRRLVVLETVTLSPTLLAPVRIGLLLPTRNFTKTQAASQLEAPVSIRQLFSQLRLNCTKQKLAVLVVETVPPLITIFDTVMLFA